MKMAQSRQAIAVGLGVWVWDGDKPRYGPDGKPLGRGDFVAHLVKAETRVSWIIGEQSWNETKFNKKSFEETGSRFGYTARMYGDAEKICMQWKTAHIEKVVAYVRAHDSLGDLKMIAAMVGYNDE